MKNAYAGCRKIPLVTLSRAGKVGKRLRYDDIHLSDWSSYLSARHKNALPHHDSSILYMYLAAKKALHVIFA